MPDPKAKSLDERIAEASAKVLGTQQAPSNETMSDDDLLAAFGGGEKKKDIQSSPKIPQQEQTSSQDILKPYPWAEELSKPKSSESGDGSLDQSSEPVDNGVNPVMSTMASVVQKFYDAPSQLLESIAIGTDAILGSDSELKASKYASPMSPSGVLYTAEQLRGFIKELAPTNPKTEANDPLYSHSIGGSMGGMAALVVAGPTRAGQKILTELSTSSVKSAVTKMITKEAKDFIASPSVLTGAMQMGTASWEQAKASGATDEEAFDVFWKDGAFGSVAESIPIGQFFKRLDKVTGGGVVAAIKKGSVQGVEEMTTEVAQQAFSNYTAAETYDATRKLYEGMTESGGIGFGLGFVLGGLGTTLRKKQSLAQTPQEKAEIQKAIDFVDSKSSDMEQGKLTDQGQVIETKEEVSANPELPTSEQVTQEQVAPTEEVVAQEEITPQEEIAQQEVITPTEEQITTQEDIAPAEDVVATEEQIPVQENVPVEEVPVQQDIQATEEVVTPDTAVENTPVVNKEEVAKTLNERQQDLVNELPKKKVNYKEIKGIGDLSVYLNNPDALNSPLLKSAKRIYEDIKAGKPIKDTPSVNEKMELMDGQNRIAAQLAAGITDVEVAVIDKSFYDKQSQSTPKSEVKPQEVAPEVKKEAKTEITKLEEERDAEIEKISKPLFKLELVQTSDLVNSKDPIGNKEKHNELKGRYKALRNLIDCL